MSNIGKLCYKHGDGRLAYKHGGDALIYKTAPKTKVGDIDLIVTAAQAQVGPIKGCGNYHPVGVTVNGSSGQPTVTVTVAKGSRTVSGVTDVRDCAYPQNNPPMQVTIVAVQPSTGVVKQTTKNVSNVANYGGQGAFSVSITCSSDGTLTGVD